MDRTRPLLLSVVPGGRGGNQEARLLTLLLRAVAGD